MKRIHLTIFLLAGLAVSFVALYLHLRNYPFPGNQEGYMPEQPIAFSHRVHAGDLGITCLYCHFNAVKSPHAGIPPTNVCMNCHRLVTASWEVIRAENEKAHLEKRPPRRLVSPQLQKLYDFLDDKGQPKGPIPWVQVHNLPRFTRFDHRAHVQARLACQDCHGPVETMEVLRQSADLSMGWCLKCHKEHKEINGRKVTPSTDCVTCHY